MGDDAAGNHILDAFFNSHGNFCEFISRSKDQEPGSGVGHGWHEYVEHVLPSELLYLSTRLASHKPDCQKPSAWELQQDDFAKGRCVGLGDGYDHLFGACINPADEGDFFNKGFTEFEKFFPEKAGGQPADCEHDQQSDQHSQKGNTIAFGEGCTELDQYIGEHRRQGIKVPEKELQNEPRQCYRQSDQQAGDENISKSAFETFNHSGNNGLKSGVLIRKL